MIFSHLGYSYNALNPFSFKNYDMDIWSPKLIWHGIMCHVMIPKKSFFFPNHGTINCIFVMTCHEKISKFFFYLVKNIWHYWPWCTCSYIHCDVHSCKLHLQEIYYCTHPSRIKPKTLWKHTKVLPTNPLQNFINKENKNYLIVFGMKLFRKFKL
jgi:hypothetical protein